MDMTILVGAALTCALGGVAPWINSEVAVVGASLALPRSAWPALLLACAVAQMTSKGLVYGAARWSPARLPRRARKALERAERYRGRRGLLVLGLASGSLLGLPPLYLVALASGVLRMSLPLFLAVGLAGTAARYALLVWLTSIVSVF
ncbi:MAG: hypothetical protein PVJ02_17555 [Gemmatimonadota bacterium]|jgi:membrane protein YqaA with SNARE-associated domain